ncbi:MAG: cysteine-rich small domain-containing protein [Candidatus Methanomethylophilaceae archaeon]|nr:cysteine-rich small domain-containing protein [Candidatus Methanomethylophilaceae archaeon]
MRNIKRKVNEEIERGHLGSDENCEYYPCHYKGQDCTFCYCPFYPCMDERLGKEIRRRRGDTVWDCSPCLMIHDKDVAELICDRMEEQGIKDADDPRIKDIFHPAVEMYLSKGSSA